LFCCRLPVVGFDATRQGETTSNIYTLLQFEIALLCRYLERVQFIKITFNCSDHTWLHSTENASCSLNTKVSGLHFSGLEGKIFMWFSVCDLIPIDSDYDFGRYKLRTALQTVAE
jgi:hypothetical protein